VSGVAHRMLAMARWNPVWLRRPCVCGAAWQVRTLKEQLSLKEKKLRQLQDSLNALKEEFVRVRTGTRAWSCGDVCPRALVLAGWGVRFVAVVWPRGV
jgi:hypothetical protein